MRVQWEDEPNYDTMAGGERNNMIDIAMKNSSCDREERKLFKEPTDRENVKSIFGCKSKESIFSTHQNLIIILKAPDNRMGLHFKSACKF